MSESSRVCLINMWALFYARKLSRKGSGATSLSFSRFSSPTQNKDWVCVCFFCVYLKNGCVCKYFLPHAECSGVVEREKEKPWVPIKVSSCFRRRALQVKQRKCSAARKCFRFHICEARVCERQPAASHFFMLLCRAATWLNVRVLWWG